MVSRIIATSHHLTAGVYPTPASPSLEATAGYFLGTLVIGGTLYAFFHYNHWWHAYMATHRALADQPFNKKEFPRHLKKHLKDHPILMHSKHRHWWVVMIHRHWNKLPTNKRQAWRILWAVWKQRHVQPLEKKKDIG